LPSPRGDNHKRVKIYGKFLKIFSSRTSRPISIRLGINHPWVKGILNCSNEGPCPLQRGDNLKNAKMGWDHSPIPELSAVGFLTIGHMHVTVFHHQKWGP
jgi:hypothetical protein